MELGSKVTQLEEEVAVLKGEIKTILQEVRTAVLARENPFAVETYDPMLVPGPVTPPAPVVEPAAPPKVVQLNAAPDPEPQTEYHTPSPPASVAQLMEPMRSAAPNAVPGQRRWTMGSLATLIAWTQDVTARMDANDLDIVLSLARYGGLIEPELEATLTRLAAPLFPQDQERRHVGASDYLLALRELSALIEEAEQGNGASGSLRRVS
jgi:hypothetical protein